MFALTNYVRYELCAASKTLLTDRIVRDLHYYFKILTVVHILLFVGTKTIFAGGTFRSSPVLHPNNNYRDF